MERYDRATVDLCMQSDPSSVPIQSVLGPNICIMILKPDVMLETDRKSQIQVITNSSENYYLSIILFKKATVS